jgi:hypothetical protein
MEEKNYYKTFLIVSIINLVLLLTITKGFFKYDFILILSTIILFVFSLYFYIRSIKLETKSRLIFGAVLIFISISLLLILFRLFFSCCWNQGYLFDEEDTIKKELIQEINKQKEIQSQNGLPRDPQSNKIAIYPPTRKIEITKGQEGIVGILIKNYLNETEIFSYTLKATEVSCNKSIELIEADNLITSGIEGNNIQLTAGSMMDDPIYVRFSIPETTPICYIRYSIEVYYQGKTLYAMPITIDLEITD